MQRLGGWILEEPIGSGGLAEVWRARAASGGDPVAVKVLREPDRSPAHRERFLREGYLLMRLSQPGLARCLAVEDGPQPWLVLELLQGQTLSQRLREVGYLPVEQVFTMADSLLQTLAYLHERGITHRDVKASNIFFSQNQRILLLDLGLATDPAHPLITTLGDVMGTYAYMAPEQLAGAQVDHRCDLYSLGVTLYEALAGRRPYRAQNASGYLQAHRQGAPPLLSEARPEAPGRLVDLVSRLMARDPADRPPSAGVARALLAGAEDTRALKPAPLIGREAAKGAIQAALDGGSAVILQGEIGAGLGRMVAYALEIARADGREVLAIRLRERAHPLAPLHQLARDLERISGPVPPSPERIGQALRALAAESPLALVIEGIDLCPPETLRMLARILELAPGVPAILTATDPPAGLPGHGVRLRPLRPEETGRLICDMLGTSSPPAGLASRLHRISSGLPGIVVQGLRELVQRGGLVCEGSDENGMTLWRLEGGASLEPTTTLAYLYGAVLSDLPSPSRRLLEVLAVSGEAVPLALAREIAGVSPETLALEPLLRHRLVDVELHDQREWLGLRRPALGSLILAQLPEHAQQALHRGLAAALQRLPAGDWRDQLIAWHVAYGAPPAEAARALTGLAEDLNRRGQRSRALQVLDRAARIDAATSEDLALLSVVRGEVLEAEGRRQEALDALRRGQEQAHASGDAALQGRALVGQAMVQDGLGLKQQAAVLAEEAMALLEGQPGSGPMLQALLIAANCHRLGARRELAARLYNRCIDLAVDQDRREFAAMGHGGLGAMLAEDGHIVEAVLHLEQETSYARLHHLPARLVLTLCRLSNCHRRAGRPDLALEDLDEAEHVARTSELPYELVRAQLVRASVHLSIGDLQRAGALLYDNRIALQPGAAADLRLMYREVMAHYRLVMGDRQAALATFQAAEMEAAQAGFAVVGAYFLGMIGVLTADPDALLEAMDTLEDTGDRRLSAALLFYGGTVGGDVEVLEFAVEEARASGDRLLLLEVLHAVGDAAARAEARQIAAGVHAHLPASLRPFFEAHPPGRWCLSEGPLGSDVEIDDKLETTGSFRPDFELVAEAPGGGPAPRTDAKARI